MATGLCRDHDFEYRAVTPDGDVRRLYDVVHVVLGPKGIPTRLRGIMLDVTGQKRTAGVLEEPARVIAHSVHT